MQKPTFAPPYVALFPQLSEIARECGYSLTVHGSVQRDLDLVAIPWTYDAQPAEELVQRFGKYLRVFEDIFGTALHGPEEKPHGRRAWLFATCFGSAIDLSVMPRVEYKLNDQTAQAKDSG